MKILLINNDKGWGGGQEFLKDLASELLGFGVDVHFTVRAGSKSDSRLRGLGVPVHALPGHGIGDVKAFFQLVDLMRRERFDIISVNREHDLLLTTLARYVAFPFRKHGKLVITCHVGTARKQHLLFSVDAVVCVSEHVRKRLSENNPAAGKKAVILPNGVVSGPPPAAMKFDFHRERRFFRGAPFPLIGMVGEFFKNQSELVDVLALLKGEFPNLTVAFVGDTSDQGLIGPLLEKIRYLDLERDVLFTGRIPRELMPDVFYDLDLSVSTFRNEGYGLVHLESLAAGTPVVAYNEGGVVDILRGENVGILVDGGPSEFAAAVADLLRDHERRYAMGRQGNALVEEKYSRSAMTARYLELFRRLSGEGNAD
jgi:glycosyltransferase involved in cell wall biosynthesis